MILINTFRTIEVDKVNVVDSDIALPVYVTNDFYQLLPFWKSPCQNSFVRHVVVLLQPLH